VFLAAIALLVLAMVLVAAELFVPSHGVLTIFAFIAAAGSVFFAYRFSPGAALIFVVLIVVAAPVVFYWAVKLYPTTTVGKRVLLAPPSQGTTVTGFNDDAAKLEQLVGRQGVAMSLLRPSGTIDIAGRRIDAMSESEIIPPGVPVEVIKVSGLKVIVKALD